MFNSAAGFFVSGVMHNMRRSSRNSQAGAPRVFAASGLPEAAKTAQRIRQPA
jgi:hypothetical protein